MTKKILLKWLDEKKAEALLSVEQQRAAAKDALDEWKYKEAGLEALVAEIGPKINEVHDRVIAWRAEHVDVVGQEQGWYGTVRSALHDLAGTPDQLTARMKRYEFTTCDKDRELKIRFDALRAEVEKTYGNVKINVNKLPNAKLGIEYLEGLGFDLSGLKADDERPVETALAVPINTKFLLIKPKEEKV